MAEGTDVWKKGSEVYRPRAEAEEALEAAEAPNGPLVVTFKTGMYFLVCFFFRPRLHGFKL